MLNCRVNKDCRGYTFIELLCASLVAFLICEIILSALLLFKKNVNLANARLQLVNNAYYISTWMRNNLFSNCLGEYMVSTNAANRILFLNLKENSDNCENKKIYLSKSSAGIPSLYLKKNNKRSVALGAYIKNFSVEVYQNKLTHIELLFYSKTNLSSWQHDYVFAGKKVAVNDNNLYLPWDVWLDNAKR